MPVVHQWGAALQAPRWLRCSVGNRSSEQCLFLRLCGIHKTCNYSSRLLDRCAREWAACTQIARRYRRTGTVCSSVVQAGTWDIFRSGRNLELVPRRNSHNVPASQFQPCGASAAPDDPRSADPRMAVFDPGVSLFSRLFPRLDNRGDYTCDPQTPPSVIFDGPAHISAFLRILAK